MSPLALIICLILFAFWKLDFIASLLNLKALDPKLPKEFEGVFKQEEYEKSQHYTCATERFGIIESIVSLTLLLVFWFAGGFFYLDEWVRGFGFSALWTGVCYICIILFAQTLLSLPLKLYETFVIEERFGFNKTSVGTFFLDQFKGLLVGAIIGVPLLALLLWIFASVSHAWIWAWIAFTLIQLVLMYFAPSVIMPLFNKFNPMPEGELKQAIEAMAKKCNFPLTGLFEIDGSKRSTKSNAFFTGFGKRKKIALFDTLIKQHSTEELVGVLAHEIGHYKCKHIVKMMIMGLVQIAAIFFLLGLATDPENPFASTLFEAFMLQELPKEQLSVYAGFVFFFILFSPLSRIIGLFSNWMSRKHEFEADAYAAKVQGTSMHLISALKGLSKNNLVNLTPHPLPVFLDYSHPPMLERIAALEKLDKQQNPQSKSEQNKSNN